jgi:hypothetical protein
MVLQHPDNLIVFVTITLTKTYSLMKSNMLRSLFAITLVSATLITFGQGKEERDLSSFTGISLGISGDLYLTQGSPQKVIIQAENNLDKIETVVRDGVLQIKTDNWSSKIKGVKIWITMPEVETLNVSGSGNLLAETSIDADELELKVSGSGKIKIPELKGDEIEAAISGSGDMILAGSADEMEIRVSGSGSVYAERLKVNECGIKISGSGSCRIDVTGELDASISGSGRVTYYGNPQVDARVSGSGNVKKGDR